MTMNKSMGEVLERAVRATGQPGQAGATKRYIMPQKLRSALGQGKTLLFHGHIHNRSPNGSLSIYVYHGCLKGLSPVEFGTEVSYAQGGTHLAIASLGSFFFSTSGDLMGDIEVYAEVSGQGAAEFVECELWVSVLPY